MEREFELTVNNLDVARHLSQGLSDSEPTSDATTAELRRAQQLLTAMSSWLRAVEADRDTWRQRYAAAAKQRDRERSALAALKVSRSYRIGRALVSLLKDPVRTLPRLVRALVRRVLSKRRPRTGDDSHSTPMTSGPAFPRLTVPQRPVLSEHLPVRAYVALGFGPDALRSLAGAAAQCAVAASDHVPLIVTDSPSFSLVRDTGVAMEYIPNRNTWDHHREDVSWDRFAEERLTRILRDHQPTRTFFLNQSDVGLPQLLLTLGE